SHLETAIRLEPSLAPAYRELARVSYALKNPRESIEALERYLQLSPRDAEAQFRLGDLYRISGRLDLAEPRFEAATRLDSGRAPSLLALGQCYLSRLPTPNRLRKARECFTRALDAEPGAAELWCNLGLTDQRQRRWRDAAAHL